MKKKISYIALVIAALLPSSARAESVVCNETTPAQEVQRAKYAIAATIKTRKVQAKGTVLSFTAEVTHTWKGDAKVGQIMTGKEIDDFGDFKQSQNFKVGSSYHNDR